MIKLEHVVLANIYKSRKDHKLDEWRNFCKWIEELPCLLRNDFMVGSLSEEILNMTVTGIENDENIENTVVVYVTDEED